MKVLLILCIILFSTISDAQVLLPVIGIGISLNASSTTNYSFQVPINLEHVRINPEIGIKISSNHTNSTTTYSSSSTNTFTLDNSSQNISIASGFYYLIPLEHEVICYVGPKVGIVFSSSRFNNSSVSADSLSTSRIETTRKLHSVNYTMGVSFGAEYLFTKHFSIGGEVQLYYLNQGEPVIEETRVETPPEENPTTHSFSNSGSSFNQATSVYLRWYF